VFLEPLRQKLINFYQNSENDLFYEFMHQNGKLEIRIIKMQKNDR